MYIVIADSCLNCNSRIVALLSHKPSEIELRQLENEIGTHCVRAVVYEIEPDGDIVEGRYYDD